MTIKSGGRNTQRGTPARNTPNKTPSSGKGMANKAGNAPARPKPGKANVQMPTGSGRANQGMQSGSGGGAKSRQVTHAGGSDLTRKVSVPQVSQLGQSVGSHVTGAGGREVQRPNQPLYAPAQAATKMGNEIAKNVGRGGPGVGRTVYACGSQGCQGPVNPGGAMPKPVDILGMYGPESSAPKKA
jgi:hypothetical protein